MELSAGFLAETDVVSCSMLHPNGIITANGRGYLPTLIQPGRMAVSRRPMCLIIYMGLVFFPETVHIE